jgi:hypothetical protein
VKHRRELMFASLPALFAVHQFTEGFVWLGLDGYLSRQVAHNMGAAFVLFAQGLLPLLMPLSVMLFEQTRARRLAMMPFVLLGGLLTLFMLWGLTAYPLQVYEQGNSIVYENYATNRTWVAALYVVATCGSLFFSKVKAMVWFGTANLLILLVTMALKRYACTSVWCAYAAVASVITSGRAACSGRSCTQEPSARPQLRRQCVVAHSSRLLAMSGVAQSSSGGLLWRPSLPQQRGHE